MWTDHSDKRRRFFMGDTEAVIDEAGIRGVADSVIDFLVTRIAIHGAGDYDRLFFQVTSDTGLLLATLGTEPKFAAGTTEGLGIRWRRLADRYEELSRLEYEAFAVNRKELESNIYDACLLAARARRSELLAHTKSEAIEFFVVDPFEPNSVLRKSSV